MGGEIEHYLYLHRLTLNLNKNISRVGVMFTKTPIQTIAAPCPWREIIGRSNGGEREKTALMRVTAAKLIRAGDNSGRHVGDTDTCGQASSLTISGILRRDWVPEGCVDRVKAPP